MARMPAVRNLKVDELITLYDNVIPDVDVNLRQSAISDSLPLPEEPEGIGAFVQYCANGDPIIPDDLTDLTSQILGKLFTFMSNWANYVASEESRAKAAKKVLERQLKVIKAALAAYYKEEIGVPANAVEDKITTDTRFVELDTAVLRSDVFTLKAGTRLEQLKRSLNLISREQTRRGEDLDRSTHTGSGASPRDWSRGARRR